MFPNVPSLFSLFFRLLVSSVQGAAQAAFEVAVEKKRKEKKKS